MRKTVAIDTNLLVLLAVGLADVAHIARHKRLYPLYRAEHFDQLLEVIRQSPALATTTHALAEASNLLRQCRDPMRSEVMAALARLIETGEELTPKARQACAQPEFFRLGLTDAAFTLLDPESYFVISADLDLIVALEMRGFEVVNFHALLFD